MRRIKNLFYSQTVTIGKQTWMTKNLDVTSFRNGDSIPEAKTDEEWKKILSSEEYYVLREKGTENLVTLYAP